MCANPRIAYSTRSAQDILLYVPRPDTSIFQNSLCYKGAVLWNSLPTSVRESRSLPIFKAKLKELYSI